MVSMQSGFTIPIIDTTETALPVVNYILKLSNCQGPNHIECLRKIDAETLSDISTKANDQINSPINTIYGPAIDGDWIPRQHHESLELGLFRKVPLMITSDLDEAYVFFINIRKQAEADKLMRKMFPFMSREDMDQMHKNFPNKPLKLPFYNASEPMSLWLFQCPARRLARAYTNVGLPVYKMLFMQPPSMYKLPGIPKMGVSHVADLVFW